ncbi:MAG: NAD(P)/FAD-dependent oxidoreductase [Bacteroidales bacterium]|nr:NAD(P)/FAD-dependent oxidoreductase [Bacteroidales bacterium]
MTQTSSQPKQRVVIIGGGFAGLNLVKTLDRNKFEVTLINRHNYHSFPPLFYQIASSGLDPGDICFPLRREMFRRLDGKNISLIMGNATAVDVNRHVVKLDDREVEYDKLVIATGTTNNFFNMPELQQDVYTLKSAPQAIRCRNQILYNLEKAANVTDPVERRRLLSFVVIGGGPTGVEIAGALGEMKRYVVPREYPSIPQEDMRILLVEAAPKLLGTMDPRSSEEVEGYLKHLLVDVKSGVGMQSYKEGIVQLADGETIDSDTVIWTAGVTGVKLDIEGADIERGRGNRFVVDGQNRVKGIDDVYAIGDIAIMPDVDPAFPGGHPQLAQVAIQQSRLLAKNLNQDANKSFVYNDKGTMATVGRNRAVADLGKLHLKGFPAWFIWMFIHLISILGMRNKISVLINWIWAYFSYQSSLRVLIRPDKYPVKNRWREK